MNSLFKSARILLLVMTVTAGAALLGEVGFLAYQHEQRTTERIVSLEGQVSALSHALQESNAISAENKRQIKELTEKNSTPRTQDELLTAVVERAAPAVVSIVVSKYAPLLEVEYVNPLGGGRDIGIRTPVFRQVGTTEQKVGAGTGFLVHANGYILTNRHVVADEEAEYTVLLPTGEKRNAKVVTRDDTHDLAILKIDGKNYKAITIGREAAPLKLGQTVVAIGNALGEYNNTVSVGIISGLGRTIEARDSEGRMEVLKGVIQTDTAINHGNSGGPLLDLSGNVVGVNVAMSEGANNIAFAIPLDAARTLLLRVLPAF